MDFLPTFAGLAGAKVPDDRIIDGKDIWPLMQCDPEAKSPHEAFFYYRKDTLDAVRVGRWKLHVHKIETGPIRELYDLERDIRESVNVCDEHPEVVAKLEKLLDECRDDLGDSVTGITGKNRRLIGRVENPKPLTEYDENHPYVVAMYDLPDNG
jgi:arylsulfatase A-like enzyme